MKRLIRKSQYDIDIVVKNKFGFSAEFNDVFEGNEEKMKNALSDYLPDNKDGIIKVLNEYKKSTVTLEERSQGVGGVQYIASNKNEQYLIRIDF